VTQNHACNAKPFGEARTQTAAFGDVRGGMLTQGSIERGDSSSQQGPAMHAKSTAAWSTTRRSLAASLFKTKGICFDPPVGCALWLLGRRMQHATTTKLNEFLYVEKQKKKRFLICICAIKLLSLTSVALFLIVFSLSFM